MGRSGLVRTGVILTIVAAVGCGEDGPTDPGPHPPDPPPSPTLTSILPDTLVQGDTARLILRVSELPIPSHYRVFNKAGAIQSALGQPVTDERQ